MKKILIIILYLSVATNLSILAQVTIGSTKKPAQGAILMLDDGTSGASNENATKGLGLPRVELQAYDKLQMGLIPNAELVGKESEHAGLLVYNIDIESKRCDPNYPTTGLHIWDGKKWQGLSVEPHFVPTTERQGPRRCIHQTAIYLLLEAS